jgi:RNA polymerase sigma factor (sigma-70 family)
MQVVRNVATIACVNALAGARRIGRLALDCDRRDTATASRGRSYYPARLGSITTHRRYEFHRRCNRNPSLELERASVAGSDALEAQSFDRFVAEHRLALVRVAALLSGSVAQGEDLVQDVLVRLYPRWGSLADPLPYVRRCVTNEFLSWRRRWSTRHIRVVPDAVLAEQPVDPWADSTDPQLWARVLLLPRQQRAAVVLRYYEGLDDSEIAAVLSCRPATVRGHISRGLAALRQDLALHTKGGRDA